MFGSIQSDNPGNKSHMIFVSSSDVRFWRLPPTFGPGCLIIEYDSLWQYSTEGKSNSNWFNFQNKSHSPCLQALVAGTAGHQSAQSQMKKYLHHWRGRNICQFSQLLDVITKSTNLKPSLESHTTMQSPAAFAQTRSLSSLRIQAYKWSALRAFVNRMFPTRGHLSRRD